MPTIDNLAKYFEGKSTTKLGNALKPMGEFPIIDARDVIVDYDENTKEEKRLPEKLDDMLDVNKLQFTINGDDLYVSYDGGVIWRYVGKMPGKDGKTPFFKIEDGQLYVSYDNGGSFSIIGPLLKGDPGTPGAPGAPGKTPSFKIENGNLSVSYDDGDSWVNIGIMPGGSNANCIVDVNYNLPAQNIKENVIYRLTTYRADVYLALESGELIDGRAYLGNVNFMTLSPKVVPILPNALEIGRVYIVKDTGIGYVNVGNGIKTLGEQATGMTGWDKGFLPNNPEAGYFYSKIEPIYTYHACKDGVWIEFAKAIKEEEGIKQIQAVTTPEKMYEILNNATTENVGDSYIYVGVTNDRYKRGHIYKVTAEVKE